MNHPPTLRVVLGRVLEDREFVASFGIGLVVLLAEMIAPAGWSLPLGSAAFGLLLAGFIFYLYGHVRTAQLLFQDKAIPILFAINTPRQEAIRALALVQESITELTGFKAFSKIEGHFNVHYEDLVVHRGDTLPADPGIWHDFLEGAQQEVRQFLQHVPGGRVYHVAIRGPSSLALGLGAMLSTRSNVVAYHFDGNGYRPVLDLTHDSRRIKASLPGDQPFQFIKAAYPAQVAQDTAIVLDLAGHVASGDVKDYLVNRERSYPLVEVTNTYGGNLTATDWAPVVQELFQVFNALQRQQGVRRIHLFQSMPVPLALGLGMALGTFVPVTVYNWERAESTYYPVLYLNEIRGAI